MFKAIAYRSANAYDTEVASNEAALQPDEMGESMTVQEHALDCDINEIVRRFGYTRMLPVSSRIPEYGDFTDVSDYRTALHAVMDAQDNFMALPAKLRARFDNDPQLFLEFCSDPANLPEMRELGIANKENVSGPDTSRERGTSDQRDPGRERPPESTGSAQSGS